MALVPRGLQYQFEIVHKSLRHYAHLCAEKRIQKITYENLSHWTSDQVPSGLQCGSSNCSGGGLTVASIWRRWLQFCAEVNRLNNFFRRFSIICRKWSMCVAFLKLKRSGSYLWIFSEQECIPVGCVPPAAVAVPGGLHQAPPWEQTPWDQAPPQTRHLSWDQAPPPKQTPPRNQAPPPVNRILDTRLWKYYLTPNFVCGR